MKNSLLSFLAILVLSSTTIAQQPLFESKAITVDTPQHRVKIDVDISGAKKLFLVVDSIEGYSCDWAAWANPALLTKDGEKIELTSLKWKRATAAFGSVQINKNCEGYPIRINGTAYENGIGTHANSVIEFDLPVEKNIEKFTAIAGLDNGGTDQAGGVSASVKFHVYTKKPPKRFYPERGAAEDGNHDLTKVLAQFDVHEELQVSLFAAEPMLVNPTNIDIDHLGRVWVCEVTNYRAFANRNPQREEGDRILILEDTNQDGTADESKVFYQGKDIDSVHGICVLGNRALVSAGDSVFWLIDDDGDWKADRKELLFTGIGGTQHDHGIHAFVFGPDGKLYFNFGNSGRQILDKAGQPIVDVSGTAVRADRRPYQEGMVFRCNFDGSEFETLAWNFRNNWEVCVDSFGRIWQSDNDDDGNRGVRINFVMEHGNYGYRDETDGSGWRDARTGMHEEIPLRHWHQNDPGVIPNLLQTGAGSPTGICFYEGDFLPKVFRNQMIHCDAGPSVVRAYPIRAFGAGYTATMENIMNGAEYNKWFRPSDVCVAPDGSIIVSDWYDPGVGGHRMGDVDHGRLFRITPKGKARQYQITPPEFRTPQQAIESLKSPNQATRFLAWQVLKELGEEARQELEKLLKDPRPEFRARALWLLTKLGLPENDVDEIIRNALNDPNPEVMATAIRCIRQLPNSSQANQLIRSIDLEHAPVNVRREILISMSERNRIKLADDRLGLLGPLLAGYDGRDRWYLEALGIALHGKWDTYLNDSNQIATASLNQMTSRAKQEYVWRSRGQSTAALLCEFIAAPDSSVEDSLKFIRSLDFVSHQNNDAPIASLAFGDRLAGQEKFDSLFPELLFRLKANQFNPQQMDVIDAYLDRNQGTQQFIQLVKRLDLKDRYDQLIDIAIENANSQLRFDSVLAIVDRQSAFELDRRLNSEGDEQRFGRLCQAIAMVGRNVGANVLSRYIKENSHSLERRRIAVANLGRFREGANTILKWLDAKELDAQLEPAVAAVLHAAPWRDVSTRAKDLFPVASGKDSMPIPDLANLSKRRGDIENGKTIYEGAGTCAKCHLVNGVGTEVGPDLSEIGNKLSRTAIYESILFPSAGISHSYENWSVLTVEGALIQGILVSETEAELQLKNKDGLVQRIHIADIEEKKVQKLSMMPEGLHEELTLEELVDLVEYLGSLK